MIAAVILEATALDARGGILLRRLRADGRHLALAGPGAREVATRLGVGHFVHVEEGPFARAVTRALETFRLPAVAAVAVVATWRSCEEAGVLGIRRVAVGPEPSETSCEEAYPDASTLLDGYDESVFGQEQLLTSDSITS